MNIQNNTTKTQQVARGALLVLLILGLIFGGRATFDTVRLAPETLITSLIFSAVYLGGFYLLFRFTRIWPRIGGTWLWLPAALVWGAFVTNLFVDLAGGALYQLATQLHLSIFSASLAGAFPEEVGKMLGVLLVCLACSRIRAPWHVFIVAVFVGLGFTILENIGYGAAGAMVHPDSDTAGAMQIWLMRSGLGLAAHSIYTAAASWGLARALFAVDWSRGRKILTTLGWAVVGFALHFLWNSAPSDALVNLGKVIIMSLVSYILFLVLFLRARKMAKQAQAVASESTVPSVE